MRIGSAALARNGMANGDAATAAAPSNAWRRGTKRPVFLALISSPFVVVTVRMLRCFQLQYQPSALLVPPTYREDATQATRGAVRRRVAESERPCGPRHLQ